MSNQFNPEPKSTCNICLDVAEPISSLIIIERGVFAPPDPSNTGMCVNMSRDSMSLAYIASTSSDAMSKATECISRQILLSSDNSLLFLSQLSHVWSSVPNTSILQWLPCHFCAWHLNPMTVSVRCLLWACFHTGCQPCFHLLPHPPTHLSQKGCHYHWLWIWCVLDLVLGGK